MVDDDAAGGSSFSPGGGLVEESDHERRHLSCACVSRLTPRSSAAVEKYLARIAELEKNDPLLLLAYAYHLYMAFLVQSGIVEGLRRDEKGLAVFDMGGANASAYKERYDALVLSEDQIENLLKESVEVFVMNNNVSFFPLPLRSPQCLADCFEPFSGCYMENMVQLAEEPLGSGLVPLFSWFAMFTRNS
eukprot:745884-Hanusia_phi.AAC.1